MVKNYNTVLDRQHAQRVRNALRQIGIEVYLSEYYEDTYLDVYCSLEDVETINEIIDQTKPNRFMYKEINNMRIYKDEPITSFEFWSGAKDTVKYLTDDEMDTIESILEELYPEGLSETEINDIFWFEDDLIAEWLGYEDFEAMMDREEV